MYTRGKHVLVVDDDQGYQQVFEMIVQHTGRWPTIARNGDEAMAILRSTLHPLIVTINGSMRRDGGGYGTLALSLLATSDFATTHAFVMRVDEKRDGVSAVDALREEIARLNVGFVALVGTPPGLGAVFTVLRDAENYLTSRG